MHFSIIIKKHTIQVLYYENYIILVLNFFLTPVRLADGNKQDPMVG